MKDERYYNICEELWQNWKADSEFIRKEISDGLFNYIKKAIHCPEPYLRFGNTEDTNTTMFFLTTNPGQGDSFQQKDTILSNDSIVKISNDYNLNALKLGIHYTDSGLLKGAAAKRIQGMFNITGALKYNGFIQMECFPFHSDVLQHKYKEEIIKLSKLQGNFINTYVSALKQYCSDKNIIVIGAANKQSIVSVNDWVKFQCEVIGLSLANTKSHVLKYSDNGNVSVSCLVDNSTMNLKIVSLVQGAAVFPADRVLNMLNSESLVRI